VDSAACHHLHRNRVVARVATDASAVAASRGARAPRDLRGARIDVAEDDVAASLQHERARARDAMQREALSDLRVLRDGQQRCVQLPLKPIALRRADCPATTERWPAPPPALHSRYRIHNDEISDTGRLRRRGRGCKLQGLSPGRTRRLRGGDGDLIPRPLAISTLSQGL